MTRLKNNLLRNFEKPYRYTGGEWNIVIKEDNVRCRMLLAYPDTYEIGMSHLGLRILYHLINDIDGLAAERTFSPWADMEEYMRANGLPLTSLETDREAKEFDFVGFSLQTELDFTNVLNSLDLMGLEVRSANRTEEDPIVIAGGPVVFNPEPLADFIDVFLIGDAEKALPHIMDLAVELKSSGKGKTEILRELASLQGFYVPALHPTEIDETSGYEVVVEGADSPSLPIEKTIIEHLDKYPFPQKVLVPNGDVVHNRAAVEIARGCSRGCRFCQAGVVYMPERQRSAQSVVDSVLGQLKNSGFGEVSLGSLTPNDHKNIDEIVAHLMDHFSNEGTSLSLASLSPSNLDPALLEKIRSVRKTGITIAPEAGSQRLRDVINKGINEDDILNTAVNAFKLGWKSVKLYFMVGLPTETDEDVIAIAELAKKIAGLKNGIKVKLACSNFVPKSHTAFQWLPMGTKEEFKHKHMLIKQNLGRAKVDFSSHDIDESLLEGVLSRGDRRIGKIIERSWKLGCSFDGWSDKLRLDLWQQAYEEAGVDPEFYLHRQVVPHARLPWSHIHTGVSLEFLQSEYQKSLGAELTLRCEPANCPRCKACSPQLLRERWGKQEKTPDLVMPEFDSDSHGDATPWCLRFSKTGELLAIGHLDFATVIARTFRRAGLKLAMSQGFNPQPKIALASPLPLGQEGVNEYLDVHLIEPPSEAELLKRLNKVASRGLEFTGVMRLPKKRSLMAQVVAAEYTVTRNDGDLFAAESVDEFVQKDTLEWTRHHKGKTKRFDIRGMILEVEILNNGGEMRYRVRLDQQLQARPAEVVEAIFGLRPDQYQVRRDDLLVGREGELLPPM